MLGAGAIYSRKERNHLLHINKQTKIHHLEEFEATGAGVGRLACLIPVSLLLLYTMVESYGRADAGGTPGGPEVQTNNDTRKIIIPPYPEKTL